MIQNTLETNKKEISCYKLRAKEYGKHYRNIPKDLFIDEFDNELLNQKRATTLFLESEGGVIGTLRVIIAWQKDKHPEVLSEINQLMHLKPGQNETDLWSYVTNLQPNIHGVAEIGKLAISREFHQKKSALRNLAKKVIAYSKFHHLNIGAFMLSPLTARVLKMANIPIQKVKIAQLNRSNPENLRYFIKYCDYFLPKLAKTYSNLELEKILNDYNDQELFEFAKPYDDGVNLYVWTTKKCPKL